MPWPALHTWRHWQHWPELPSTRETPTSSWLQTTSSAQGLRVHHRGGRTRRAIAPPTCCQRGTPKPARCPSYKAGCSSRAGRRSGYDAPNPQFLQPPSHACAQGRSCPKVALTAGTGTSGTSSQGTQDILEAQSGWGRENIPLHMPAPAGSSLQVPCSVGTPRHRWVPRDPGPDPALQIPGW